jgi:hypothetical protein
MDSAGNGVMAIDIGTREHRAGTEGVTSSVGQATTKGTSGSGGATQLVKDLIGAEAASADMQGDFSVGISMFATTVGRVQGRTARVRKWEGRAVARVESTIRGSKAMMTDVRKGGGFDGGGQVGHTAARDRAIRSGKLVRQPIHIVVGNIPIRDRKITRGVSRNALPGRGSSSISTIVAKDTRVSFDFKKLRREATGRTIKQQLTGGGKESSMTGLTMAAGIIDRGLSQVKRGLTVRRDGKIGRRHMVREHQKLRDEFRASDGVSGADTTRVDCGGGAAYRVIYARATTVSGGATVSVENRVTWVKAERVNAGVERRDIRSEQRYTVSGRANMGPEATQTTRARHNGRQQHRRRGR